MDRIGKYLEPVLYGTFGYLGSMEIYEIMGSIMGYEPDQSNGYFISLIPGIAIGINRYMNYSKREKRRRELEDQLKIYHEIFDVSPFGMVITDENRKILDINDSALKLTGRKKENILGENTRTLKNSLDLNPPHIYKEMWEKLGNGEVWEGILINIDVSTGKKYHDRTVIFPIIDDTGKLTNYVAFKEDVTKEVEYEKELEKRANIDSLTELYNRGYFKKSLEDMIKDTQNTPIGIMYLDLDGFKTVNDTLGHEFGDDVLRICSKRLKGSVRTTDIIGRLGGDEFCIALPGIGSVSNLEKVAINILDKFNEPLRYNENDYKIGTSIGLTMFPNPDNLSLEDVITRADQLMYKAKKSGKGRYCMDPNFINNETSDLIT